MLLENDFLTDFRVRKEVNSLVEENHRVIVAGISKEEAAFKNVLPECTLFMKRIPSFYYKASVGALKFPFYFNFWRSYISEILTSETPDAVHVHDLPLAKVGLELRDKYNLKMVLDLHENWPAFLEVSQHTQTFLGRKLSSERQWRIYEKDCCLQADAIITVVQEMKDRIVKTGIDPGKISILENTPLLKKTEKRPDREPGGKYILLYVGGTTYHRGIQFILEGLTKTVNKSAVKLIIAGDGRYLQYLKDLSLKLGLNDTLVEFKGKVSKPMTETLMHESDIALIPHIRSEQSDNSSPNKLYDYMSAGLPVLASDCSSVKRILQETEAGITYIYNDPADFAQKLNSLINNKAALLKMAENGLAAFTNKYHWENSARDLKSIYSRFNNHCL